MYINPKICIFGTPVNLELPSRVAEEYAMLDVLSGGRLEIALPLGTGMEYWVHPINPATSRARFRESVDIILKAWKEDGPTDFQGEFLRLPLPQCLALAYPVYTHTP